MAFVAPFPGLTAGALAGSQPPTPVADAFVQFTNYTTCSRALGAPPSSLC